MVTVYFKNQDTSIQVEKETTILEAARKAGLIVESPCNGIGTCGKCKVKLDATSLTHITSTDDRHRITEEEAAEGYVLACQSHVLDDINVEFSSTKKQNESLKILNEGSTFEYENKPYITKHFNGTVTEIYGGSDLLGTELGDTTNYLYGLSIDIGTTTVVCALIDLLTGKELCSTSALNPQSLHAQDVLTRIKFASNPEGLKEMYESIIKEFNRMVDVVCQEAHITSDQIYEAIYSGNTTMIHLAGNRNPKSLGKYPYTPVLYGGCYDLANENGIHISPFGLVYYPPIISAYVGPDITFGMRAGKGAIEYFEVHDNNKIEIRTIGNCPATGICGSGLFDIVGELIRVGIIKKNGRFIDPSKLDDDNPLKEHLSEYEGKLAFEITSGVYLTLSDVRQVQLAKGAVRSGVEALMLSQNVDASQVDKVLIAGSFGYHLRAKSLVNMGLIPATFQDKIDFVGNTSKTGGNAFLLNQDFRTEMKDLVSKINCVELANIENFNNLFVKCLNF